MSGGLDGLWGALEAVLTAADEQTVFACIALALALVFTLSGVPKLRRPELTALAMVDFGVLRRPARAAGISLGVAELALALALAGAAGASATAARLVPAVCAALLLWAFTALIARALRSPERFACACFGTGGETISGRTLARTAALALAATLLATAAPTTVAGASVTTWVLALAVAAAAVGSTVVLSTLRPILAVTS